MTDETTDHNGASESDRPPLAAISGVRYIGTSDVRTMSKTELGAVGIRVKGDLEWSADNDHFIPASALNASVIDHLAHSPNEFVLVGSGD